MFKRFWVNCPLLARLVAFLVLPVSLSVVGVNVYFRQSLPDYQTNQVVDSPFGSVNISHSLEKLPSISGDVISGAYFGLGYVHAQDRMWQMESLRHLAKGRLAELKGKQALTADIYMRTLGFEALAKSQYDNLPSSTKEWLGAYAAGVNQWISKQKILPLEYHLSDAVPETWTELDSLVLFKLFQYEYSYGLDEELTFSIAANIFGYESARALYSDASENLSADVAGFTNSATRSFSEKMLLSTGFISSEFGFGEKTKGDYAWALASQDGQSEPVVGSVVYTQATLPAKFYVAEIKAENLHVSGATIPGLPIFLHGRTQEIAWSFVPVNGDVQDVYVEQVSPTDDNSYSFGGEWHPISKREESFQVKTDFPKLLRGEIAPVNWTIRETINGPIISDAVGNAGAVFSLKWVGMDAGDTSIQSFFDLNSASNKQEILEGFKSYRSPLINLVIADKQGSVGKKIFGKLPQRKVSVSRLPVAGWDEQYQWDGYIADELLPQQWAKPGEAIVAVTGVDSPYSNKQIAVDLNDVLSKTAQTNFSEANANIARLPLIEKADVELGNKIIDKLVSLSQESGADSALLEGLVDGNTNAYSDEVKITLFYTVLRHVYQQLISDDLAQGSSALAMPYKVQQTLLNKVNPSFVYQALTENTAWCDDVRSEKIESCADLVAASAQLSKDELALLLGSDPEDWEWVDAGVLTYQHSFFNQRSVYSSLFNKESRLTNDAKLAISQMPAFSKDRGYIKSTDETYSQLIDLGTDTGLFYLSTGQSGNIFDGDYAKSSLLKLILK